MGLPEAVAGRDKSAGPVVHLLAELIGRHIKIIIDQCRGARLGLGVVEMLVGGHPHIQD